MRWLSLVAALTVAGSSAAHGQAPLASIDPALNHYPDGRRVVQSYFVPEQNGALRQADRNNAASLAARGERSIYSQPGPSDKDLIYKPKSVTRFGDLWFISYMLYYRGIAFSEVTNITKILDRSGEEKLVRHRSLPKVPDLNALVRSVEPRTAVYQGVADFQALYEKKYHKLPDLCTFAITEPELEYWVDSAQTTHLAWKLYIRSKERVHRETYLFRYGASPIDQLKRLEREDEVPAAAALLDYESLTYHVDGEIAGPVWPMGASSLTSGQGPSRVTMDGLDLRVSDGKDAYKVRVGAGGRASIYTGALSDRAHLAGYRVRAVLEGPQCVVYNGAGNPLERSALVEQVNHDGLTFDVKEETDVAQLTAFYYVNRAHEFASSVLSNYPIGRIDVYVNLSETGNALWDRYDRSLNFFRSGSDGSVTSANTAYSDIIFHEYGHAIDDHLGGVIDAAYSEGFGDALAVLITKNPIVGRDFYGPGEHLRDVRDTSVFLRIGGGQLAQFDVYWPPQFPNGDHPEPHFSGRVYAGFVWDLIERLGGTKQAYEVAKRLVLGVAALNPKDIPEAVYLTYVVDDTDHNLSNGTPHFDAITAAAKSRHFKTPDPPRQP